MVDLLEIVSPVVLNFVLGGELLVGSPDASSLFDLFDDVLSSFFLLFSELFVVNK